MTTKKIPDLYLNLNIVLGDEASIPVQISDQIIWLIASGHLHIGDKLPAIRSLAALLGINQHTVRAGYKRLEQFNIIETRQGDGSTIKKFDSSLLPMGEGRTLSNIIGLVVPSEYNPFYTRFIQGIEETAAKYKIFPIICRSQNKKEVGNLFINMLIAKKVDGIILAPFGLEQSDKSDPSLQVHLELPVPVVLVDRPNEKGQKVLIEAGRAGYLATEHLINHGYKRIAIITGLINVPTLKECFEGYQKALSEHNISFESKLVVEVNSFDYQEGYLAVNKLLDKGDCPKAIFIAGDVLAIGAMRAIKDRGLRIPEDIAIVGYNDIDIARYYDPPLTTVNVPIYEMGQQSMELLYQLIHKKPIKEKHILLPATLIVRNSCGWH